MRSTNRLLAAGWILALAVMMAWGCAGPSQPLPAPKAMEANDNLTGNWGSTKNDGRLTFNADGTFSILWAGSNRKYNGKWTVEGNEAAFVNGPGSDGCVGVVGRYLFQIRGDTVTFSVMSDDCQTRLDELRVPWAKVKKP